MIQTPVNWHRPLIVEKLSSLVRRMSSVSLIDTFVNKDTTSKLTIRVTLLT
jgi:hypothetical protein